MTTDNRSNKELAERLRQFAESQAMDLDSPYTAMMLNEVADLLAGEPTKQGIPLYGMLDVWMALYGTSHPQFDEFYEKHGYAETWARLLAEVRSRAAAGVAPQAESGHDWMTWEESGKNGTYCRNCEIWAGKSGGEACARGAAEYREGSET